MVVGVSDLIGPARSEGRRPSFLVFQHHTEFVCGQRLLSCHKACTGGQGERRETEKS